MNRKLLSGLFAGLLVLSACGDDDDDSESAATTSSTEAAQDTPIALTGLDDTFGQGGVLAMPLAPADNDRFLAVTAGEDGTFIAGWTSTAGDQSMALVKLDDSGAKDATFGQGGVATVNVAAGGKVAEVARAVVVQDDGKILIAGPAEKNPKAAGDAAKDNDVAVVRFDATGKLDPAFGTGGIARLDLGAGKPTPDGGYITDNSWGMVVLDTGRIVVFGSTPAAGRNDTDAVLAALTPAGKPDEAFGTKGVVRFDQPPTLDNARALKLDPEGRLVGCGYSRDTAGVITPYLVRVSADGVPDDSFGTAGRASSADLLPGGAAEAYAFGFVDDGFVLAGYGHGAGEEALDMISMRFDGTGKADMTWGTDGVLRVDVSGADDRGRNLMVLPDGEHVLLIGVGGTAPEISDAMVVLVDKTGKLVPGFGTEGKMLSDLGGPADAWFSGALSADEETLTLVGYKGVVEGDGGNDDSAVARIKLP